MSKKHLVQLNCPSCQEIADFTIWDSINTMLDPEMKEAVRDRSAFLFECPHCGAKTNVDYGFLYHQMEDRIIIHYANSDEDAESVYDMYYGDDFPEIFQSFRDGGYLIRIVRSQNQLREKLAIFDAGLDDRIIEIFKLYIYSSFHEDYPDSEDVELYFFTDKGNNLIQVLADDESKGFAELSLETYNSILSDYSHLLSDIKEDGPFIELQWALEKIRLLEHDS